jgi:biopolymer transport protein ExbD
VNLQPAQTDEEPEINLTSLIDVVLLLLVFFMVSTSFVKEANLELRLPEASAREKPASVQPLQVAISADGNYSVNDRVLVNTQPETLRSALQKVAGERRDLTLTIRADARTTHQSVVTVMDVAGKLGFSDIRIVTVQAEAGP